jgi:hypothetical protein
MNTSNLCVRCKLPFTAGESQAFCASCLVHVDSELDAENKTRPLPTAPTGYQPWRGVLAVQATKGATWYVPCVVTGERRVYDRRDLRVKPLDPVRGDTGECPAVWVEAGRVHCEPDASTHADKSIEEGYQPSDHILRGVHSALAR